MTLVIMIVPVVIYDNPMLTLSQRENLGDRLSKSQYHHSRIGIDLTDTLPKSYPNEETLASRKCVGISTVLR